MISVEFQRVNTQPREVRLLGTASSSSRDMPQAGELALLARRVFRRSGDLDQTVTLPEVGDAEVNLLNLNRKKEPSWPVFHFDFKPGQQDRFVSLQKWEGYVLEIQGDTFSARLIDLTAEGPEEDAVFSIRQV